MSDTVTFKSFMWSNCVCSFGHESDVTSTVCLIGLHSGPLNLLCIYKLVSCPFFLPLWFLKLGLCSRKCPWPFILRDWCKKLTFIYDYLDFWRFSDTILHCICKKYHIYITPCRDARTFPLSIKIQTYTFLELIERKISIYIFLQKLQFIKKQISRVYSVLVYTSLYLSNDNPYSIAVTRWLLNQRSDSHQRALVQITTTRIPHRSNLQQVSVTLQWWSPATRCHVRVKQWGNQAGRGRKRKNGVAHVVYLDMHSGAAVNTGKKASVKIRKKNVIRNLEKSTSFNKPWCVCFL